MESITRIVFLDYFHRHVSTKLILKYTYYKYQLQQLQQLSKMTEMAFPPFDGHFWVERDGVIIDTEFKEYDYIKKAHGAKDGMKYKEADATTQKIMIAIMMKVLEKNSLTVESFRALSVKCGKLKPMFRCCIQNSLIALAKGGVLKFGSMGWEKPNGKVWWEFGGEDWTGVGKFLKEGRKGYMVY